ncbi:hypothetical protein HK102_013126, partial [Quaeritorhiza haematococci]
MDIEKYQPHRGVDGTWAYPYTQFKYPTGSYYFLIPTLLATTVGVLSNMALMGALLGIEDLRRLIRNNLHYQLLSALVLTDFGLSLLGFVLCAM